ncbi:MAG: NADH-quinone oxidoreductase subunit NuoH [Balneolales bacterium]
MSPELTTSLIVMGLTVFAVLNSAAVVVLAERKIAAFIQNRYGPNRVGPWGVLQPLADVAKLLLKEDLTPTQGNSFLHAMAPAIPLITAIMIIVAIPVGDGLVGADINVGVLYILAITSLSVYGVTLAGWASNSKYSLLGGLRSAAQMLSYELPMGIAIASVVLFAGSLNIMDIVNAQAGWWNVFVNPIACIIFVICAFAEANRAPFDLVEAEQELVGGFHTEYSGMKFGMFFLAEYMHVVIGSMLITTFFFGGFHLPFAAYWLPEMNTTIKAILDISVFAIKTFFWVFVFIWVRWTLPRFRFDQLMKLGWSKLLPLGILNFIVMAIILFLTAS